MAQDPADPSAGWFNARNPLFGNPQNRDRLDPARGRALLAEAGFTAQNPQRFTVMISTSGSGQMLSLPMGEFMQQSLREHCGVEVSFEGTEWNTLLTATRSAPDSPALPGAVALHPSSPTSDVGIMVRCVSRGSVPPNGFDWPNREDAACEAAIAALERGTDPAAIEATTKRAHERLVDNLPWLFIRHDLNPHVMSRRVACSRSAQS